MENVKEAREMNRGEMLWVQDTAADFGFRRDEARPVATAADPWDYCRFEVCGNVFEVRDGELFLTVVG